MELANSITASGWKRHTNILAVVCGAWNQAKIQLPNAEKFSGIIIRNFFHMVGKPSSPAFQGCLPHPDWMNIG
jgi:hypothetical protein